MTSSIKGRMIGDTPERFWSKVDRRGPDECWPWLAWCSRGGYGQVAWGGTTKLAHRVAWQIAHGSEPDGFACHSCDNRSCVNPAHLWIGTHRDNMLDMVTKGRGINANWTATHCLQGHPYDEANTYLYRGIRHCRACTRQRVAAGRRRKRESAR